jgi:hypothetical protein
MRASLCATLVAAIALLSACGGGSGGGSAAGESGSGYTLTGVVAVGMPLASAKVDAWCGDGKWAASARTDAKGQYEMKLPAACTTPWVLQASDEQPGGTLLFSYLEQLKAELTSGEKVNMNVTTLTHLMTQLSFRVEDDIDHLLAKLQDLQRGDEALKKLLEQAQKQALETVNEWLPSFEAVTVVSLHLPFTAKVGDPMDDRLEALAAMRGNLTARDLWEQADMQGGDLAGGQPWKTLFGDATTLTLSGTDCLASGNPADPATATLRMQDKNLEVTLASTVFGTPRTFTVGPAGRSDFQMILNGDSPLVRLRASAPVTGGTNSLSLFTNAGVAKITMSAGTASTTCTLSNPVRRADLVAFHPAARIRSVIPAAGAGGNCPVVAGRAAYDYVISPMGDVRFNGASLPADWLDAPHAYYSESLQYGMGGPGPSYQVQLAALPTGQGIQPYYFSTVPYAVNCTAYNP